MGENIIEFKEITKEYQGVVANNNIDLSIKGGEIHAIIGENGAGKSTLMKILYGLEQPTRGKILFKGKPTIMSSPTKAIDLGIGMVHQHFMLVPSFTVAENIVLGVEPRKNNIFIDFNKAVKITEELSRTYGLEVDPYSKVESVSIGIKQRIEILKVLYKGADILILDEPTAVLTPQEAEELFIVIRNLVEELGKTVIIITHKLQEVLNLSDRVSVMRQGEVVGTMNTKDANEQILAEMMVGKEVLFDKLDKKKINEEEILRVENIKASNNDGLPALKGIDFSIKSGEVLGVAGIEGNGQSELLEVITGLREVEEGSIYINKEKVIPKDPKHMRELGIAHVPEDRLSTGLSKDTTLTDNMIMGIQHNERYSKKGIHLDRNKIRSRTDKLIKNFDIRTPSQDVLLGNLSGGNMQKLVIAREFAFNTPILIIAQPTRGVDIGAIEFIHSQIIEKRNEGCGILLISAELDEIFRLSDRIITMYEGEITGEFNEGEITKKEIGLYMTGKHENIVRKDELHEKILI